VTFSYLTGVFPSPTITYQGIVMKVKKKFCNFVKMLVSIQGMRLNSISVSPTALTTATVTERHS